MFAQAVPCPNGSTGFVPGTAGTGGLSGCVVNDETHTGEVVATEGQTPFYTSNLCPKGEGWVEGDPGSCCQPGYYFKQNNGCKKCFGGR